MNSAVFLIFFLLYTFSRYYNPVFKIKNPDALALGNKICFSGFVIFIDNSESTY